MDNRKYDIATAHSRLAKKWRNRKVTWEAIVDKCSVTRRTDETVGQYSNMSREEQSSIKDVGGFVGGYLKDGKRRNGYVAHRSMATLDIDYGTADVWEDFTMQYSCAAIIYSTHKHTPDNPRLRLVIPFTRDVTCEEYEPVCRRIAASLGIDLFDTTTYQLTRLFYWPSTSSDGEFVFDHQDGEPLDPDTVLAEYTDWRDSSEWPLGSREADARRHEVRKAGDPTQKQGLIGAFCRTYSIEDAIETFLPDVYDKTVMEGRYTYKQGSVAGGLVCYQHMYAYSNHETDPASRQLCNAFDLVRIHKFGDLDEDSRTDDITKRPSYLKMMELAGSDSQVKKLILRERKQSAMEDFGGIGEEEPDEAETDDSWTDKLDTDKKGNIKSTSVNALIVLENDPKLKGRLHYDLFRCAPVITGKLPWGDRKRWTDADDSQLRVYMEKMYGITGKDKIKDAKNSCFDSHSYHPVRDYLEGLVWDGTPRLEKAVIDYVGAEDDDLTRLITKTWMVGAVARIYRPGCKFDYCLILAGAQGVGKSTFFEVLGGEWYNGNLNAMSSDKQSLEQLRGSWLFELQELDGMKRHEASSVKAFITNKTDKYRGAYKENTDEFPRQCVFGGTTNEAAFLKDDTGDRRFWPVRIDPDLRTVDDVRDALRRDRDQLWAEAVHVFKEGCPLRLSGEMEREMVERRREFSLAELDPTNDMVELFLGIKLPVDWAAYTLDQRRRYYKDGDEIKTKGVVERVRVSAAEYVQEYLGRSRDDKEYVYKVVKFKSVMDKKPEWKFVGRQRYIDGDLYKSVNTYDKIILQTTGNNL